MILRRVIDSAPSTHGVLAGLSHPRLHHVIVSIHAYPATAWSREKSAELAGTSRSRFMASFGEVIGLGPLAYVARWRIGLARGALDRDMPPRDVARKVGYGSPSALSRAMRRQGVTPGPRCSLPQAQWSNALARPGPTFGRFWTWRSRRPDQRIKTVN